MKPLTYAEVQRRIAELQQTGATLPVTEEEAAARASIEKMNGAPFTDDEWREAAANLRAFFGLLAEWSAKEDGGSTGDALNHAGGHSRAEAAGGAISLHVERDRDRLRKRRKSARDRSGDVDDRPGRGAISGQRTVAMAGRKAGDDRN